MYVKVGCNQVLCVMALLLNDTVNLQNNYMTKFARKSLRFNK